MNDNEKQMQEVMEWIEDLNTAGFYRLNMDEIALIKKARVFPEVFGLVESYCIKKTNLDGTFAAILKSFRKGA